MRKANKNLIVLVWSFALIAGLNTSIAQGRDEVIEKLEFTEYYRPHRIEHSLLVQCLHDNWTFTIRMSGVSRIELLKAQKNGSDLIRVSGLLDALSGYDSIDGLSGSCANGSLRLNIVLGKNGTGRSDIVPVFLDN